VRSKKERGTKAVFLDRDGTIIREVDNLKSVSQLRLLPGAAKAIAAINQMGLLAIVVTNQPVIARGWLDENGVDEIHAELVKRLKRKGATLDAIYYCPHHPDANVQEYRVVCRCRKPGIGMIVQASKELGIAIDGSYMVGDRTPDILAGNRAGLRTILVKTGYGGKDGKHAVEPDHVAMNVAAAVDIIRKELNGKG
jgi:histidinol-phosphate phosphatase family protein